MDPEEVRRIASLGGKARAELGVGHQFTSNEARFQGSRGGKAFHAKAREARAKREAEAAKKTEKE